MMPTASSTSSRDMYGYGVQSRPLGTIEPWLLLLLLLLRLPLRLWLRAPLCRRVELRRALRRQSHARRGPALGGGDVPVLNLKKYNFLIVFVQTILTSVCPFRGPAFPACLWSTFARTLTLTLAWCLGGGGGGGGCCCHCCCCCGWDPGVFALKKYESFKTANILFLT